MNKIEIIKILKDWNFWDKPLPVGVKRSKYLSKINQIYNIGQVLVISGVRRSGKSYIMRQFIQSLIDQGTAKERILMVNFEDPRFIELNSELIGLIFDTYIEYMAPIEKPIILLDEIQEVKGWEKWVRMMHELDKADIIITGSNAHLLSREMATVLTGRHLDMTVYPLSFEEFDEFKKPIGAPEIREFIKTGGFPKVVLEGNNEKLLLSYFDDIINRDLIRRFRIRKGEKIKSLANFYLSNVSSTITFTSVAKFLEISSDTVEKFSGYLQSAYLVFFVKRFSFKVKEQEKSPRKVYAVDTGLADAVGFSFSENLGKLAENCVYLELLKRHKDSSEIFYWKNEKHEEVDFVIKDKNKIKQLIQVCWNPEDIKTKNREIKALGKAMGELKVSEGIVITADYSGAEKLENGTVRFVPFKEWDSDLG